MLNCDISYRIVEFASSRDVKRAIDKLDGTEINGRKIRLIEDKPRKRRRYEKNSLFASDRGSQLMNILQRFNCLHVLED